jgi:hypothetical protein
MLPKILMIESFLRQGWIDVGHLSKFDVGKLPKTELYQRLLSNSIFQAMNAHVLNLPELINFDLIKERSDTEYIEYLTSIKSFNLFKACSFLNGDCLAEYYQDFEKLIE